jgi:hypothetical protein
MQGSQASAQAREREGGDGGGGGGVGRGRARGCVLCLYAGERVAAGVPFGYWATSDEWAAVFSPLALSIQHGESGVFVCNFLLVFEIKKLDSSKSNKLETPFQEFLSFSLSRSSSF